MSLSQLLTQARTIVEELNSIKLSITEQPQEHWKRRTINYFKESSQACIQDRSGKEKNYPRIEVRILDDYTSMVSIVVLQWSHAINYSVENLFVLIQVVSYNNNPHPSNFIVPAGTKINQSTTTSRKRKRTEDIRLTLNDLNISDKKFDEKTRSILIPVTSEECRQCEKR